MSTSRRKLLKSIPLLGLIPFIGPSLMAKEKPAATHRVHQDVSKTPATYKWDEKGDLPLIRIEHAFVDDQWYKIMPDGRWVPFRTNVDADFRRKLRALSSKHTFIPPVKP